MERTKLTSVRLDSDTLRLIDDYCAKHRYFKRSFVINRILTAALKCCDSASFWEMMESYDPYGDGLKMTIEKKPF